MNMGRDIDPERRHSRVEELGEAADLLDLAMRMRDHGVESLLFADSDGLITRVVTDRQIAVLATDLGGGQPVSVPYPRLERPAGAERETTPGRAARAAADGRAARVPSQLPPEPAPVEAERLNRS